MASTLTAANTQITITQSTLFPSPQGLSGYAANDVTDMPAVDVLEHLMGVDGLLSFGWIWTERMQEITLQANSPSCAVFDTINNAQQAAQDVYTLSSTIIFSALGLKYTCTNGGLKTYKPLPQAQKIYRERKFRIVWNLVVPSLYNPSSPA
jgi:hypothetical protein